MKIQLSIRTAWYALVALIAFVPMVILFVLMSTFFSEELLRSTFVREAQVLHEIKNHTEGEYNRLVTVLQNKSDPIAHVLEEKFDKDLVDKLLETVLLREKAIEYLVVLDRDVRVLTEVSRSGIIKPSFSPESPETVIPFFGRNFTGSPILQDNGNIVFKLSVPIGPLDQPSAILFASVNASKFWERVHSRLTRPNVLTYIVDNQGKLMTHPPGSKHSLGHLLTHQKIIRVLLDHREWNTNETYVGISSLKVYGVGAHIEKLNWGLVSEIPEETIKGPIQKLVRKVSVVLIIAALLLGALGLIFINWLSNPLLQITEAFSRIGKGDYALKPSLSHFKEFNVQFSGLMNMISKIRKREEDLIIAERRTNLLITNAMDGIITIREDGSIETFNPAAEKIFGYSKDEIIGKPITLLMPEPHKSDHPRYIQDYLKTGIKKAISITREVEGLRKNGSLFNLEISLGEMAVDGQQMYTGIVRDITERKEAERTIKEFSADLQRTNEELESFTYTASHDLQEPLRKVIMLGDRLQESCSGKLESNETGYIQRMQKAAFRMKDLIEDILGYTRLTQKQSKFELLNLNHIAQEVLDDLEVLIDSTAGNVQVDNLPEIEADKIQMRQLFQNIISNGLKYNNPDVSPQIRVKCLSNGDDLQTISISDNGIGFDEKFKDKIFKPFQRLHDKRDISGSGMGLFICYKIVTYHKGLISVESQPEKGTTFHISLPKNQPK